MPNRLLPSTLLCALAVAGCGSGSQALSKQQLTDQANAICKRINDGIKGAGPTSTAAGVAAAAPKISVIELEGVSDLRKLRPPRSLQADWTSFLSKMQALTGEATKIGAAARSGDQTIISTVVSEATQASTNSALAANKLGLTECARQG